MGAVSVALVNADKVHVRPVFDSRGLSYRVERRTNQEAGPLVPSTGVIEKSARQGYVNTPRVMRRV